MTTTSLADQFVQDVLVAAFARLGRDGVPGRPVPLGSPTVRESDLSATILGEMAKLRLSNTKTADLLKNVSIPEFKAVPEGIFPSEAELTTHLQLLHLFRQLRETVTNTDGYLLIYNSYVRGDITKMFDRTDEMRGIERTKPAEIRWMVYVARAVARYTKWFNALPALDVDGEIKLFGGAPVVMDAAMLPPIDVLMVWFTHMLHPNAYWEDCLRTGHHGMFMTMPFPFEQISKVLTCENGRYAYKPSYDAVRTFEALIHGAFDPLHDLGLVQSVECLYCHTKDIEVDWSAAFMHGWAEKDFQKYCPQCGTIITADILGALKFLNDLQQLQDKRLPMKGTLVDYFAAGKDGEHKLLGIANDFVRRNVTFWDLKLLAGQGMYSIRGNIRDNIEKMPKSTKQNPDAPLLKMIEIPLRKMCQAYFDNPSIFSVDLRSAVLRQTEFVDSMTALSYLTSPFCNDTLTRALSRFVQFFQLIKVMKGAGVVPPVDVDLVWHTFQLSPAKYLATCLFLFGTHVDHDDSVVTDSLIAHGKNTSKLWRKQFPNDLLGYDGCTCVFCETERQFTTISNGAGSTSLGRKMMSRLGGSTDRNKKRGKYIDDTYRSACSIAQSKGMTNVVVLEPCPGPKGEAVEKHPYLAFYNDDQDDSRHSTWRDYKAGKCITLTMSGKIPDGGGG
ncbi:uncharacterized protein V1518DRAFT_432883 [Limtongia smithiae]|uniref:uncharacterized protein n=1 Tax=Limtongia smithiae TaxID=1125753 RepID=UPI0034CFEDFD